MHLTVCCSHVTYVFQSESTLCICLNVKEPLTQNRRDVWSLRHCNGTGTRNHFVCKRTLIHLAKRPTDLAELWVRIFTLHLTECSFHVTYPFPNEFTFYICLNIKELLKSNRCDIWSLSDCKGTRTQHHLVCKKTLNKLAKLTKCLSWILSTYLYGAFDCMLLSCHVHGSEWTQTLFLPEFQGSPYSKLLRYLQFKWVQWNPNP